MILRSYQVAAVDWLRVRKRGAVVAPAGSGKTLIAAGALAAVLQARTRNGKVHIGWLANTLEQCQQARAALAAFHAIVDLADVSVRCAAAGADWSACTVLVVDEAHHGAAPGWRKQIESCQGARWGFTATPPDEPEAKRAFLGLFSEVYTVPRESVSGQIACARVVMLSATDPGLREPIDKGIAAGIHGQMKRYGEWMLRQIDPDGTKDPVKVQNTLHAILYQRVAWNVAIELGIVGNQARNAAAVAAARRHVEAGDSVLVLVNQIEHGKELAAAIPGACACWSGMGSVRRRVTLQRFAAGEMHCIVATSLADEGLDVPRANVLVLVSGGRSKAKTEQRTGRVLRTFAEKTHGLIYDFTDKQHPMMEKHSQARVALYRKLGYQV